MSAAESMPLVWPGDVEWIPANQLNVPTEYQRPVYSSLVKRIATRFDANLFGHLVVSERGPESYAVIDGQQRLSALRLIGYKEQPVPCEVHRGLSQAQEAGEFARLNKAMARKSLTPLELFAADLLAEEPDAVAIQVIVQEAGWELVLERGIHPAVRRLNCVPVLRSIYGARRYGPEDLRDILAFLDETWPEEPLAGTALVLQTARFLFSRYRKRLDRERLSRVLRDRRLPLLIDDGLYMARVLRLSKPEGIGEVWLGVYDHGRRHGNRLGRIGRQDNASA